MRLSGIAALLLVAWLAVSAAADEAVAAGSPRCPADILRSRTVPEGCACNPTQDAVFGACAAGYVCSQPWPEQVAAAARTSRRLLLDPPSSGALTEPAPVMPADTTTTFMCMACSYGQLCPRGSVLPPVLDPSIQMAVDSLACPAGFYCPTPAAARPCPPGYFCAPSTIQPVTCNMTLLMAAAPNMQISFKPASVTQRVFLFGDPLQGNSCPANATNPATLCPAGSYCPEPALNLTCPAGHFCKKGSLRPQPCPVLATCPEGSASADLSYSGFVMLGCLMAAMWICYFLILAVIRFGQRELGRQQEVQDRLFSILHPLLGPGSAANRTQSFRSFRGVRPRLTLQFESVGLTLHDGRSILSGVTGRFEHSRLAAILGPSGAGKTTFLTVLQGKAGASGQQTGRLLVNGREMQMSQLRSVTGFVPQDDTVHEDLTVRENLVCSARLRLSASKTADDKAGLVEDAIELLQLHHVQHQVVGSVERRGISGGQRKRTNIGIELVAKPSILFMDEPTSGLDSTAAADILGALMRMARLGMNVITVVHQPRFSIFRMFDDVMLLGKGGRLVFLGPSHLALPYFAGCGFALPPNENPADFLMDVICGAVPRQGDTAAAFQPSELFNMWTSHGVGWVQLQSKIAAKEGDDEEDGSKAGEKQAQRGVDPEQLAELEEQFDAQDGNGDGALDAKELLKLLTGLGLQPTQRSVTALMRKLDVPRSGLLTKQAFLHYVLSGGRAAAPTPGAMAGGIPARQQRRADTLYRVWSIEQYTLANALSELSASGLAPGVREAGAATLRELAAAHHAQEEAAEGQLSQQTEAASEADACSGGDLRSSEGGDASSIQAGGGQQSSLTSSSRQLSFTESPVRHLHLPGQPQSPFSQGQGQGQHEGASAAPQAFQRQKAFKAPPAVRPTPVPVLVEVQQEQQGGASEGLLAWVGLSAGKPLRTTPGAAAQFGILLFRSGTKWVRSWSGKMLELLLLILAAIVCGVMQGPGGNEWNVRGNTALAFLALGLLSGATALPLFGFSARVVWWREQERGVKPFSYFLAASVVGLIDVAVQPLVFLSIYYSMTLPAIPFVRLYGVGVLVVWFSTALGHLMSLLIPPSTSLLATMALLMITGGMLNGINPNYATMAPSLRAITSLSYNRWAIEIVTIESFANFPVWRWPATKTAMNQAGYCGLYKLQVAPEDDTSFAGPLDRDRLLDIRQYCINAVPHAVLVMLALGLVLRILTALSVAYCSHGLRLGALVAPLARYVGRARRRRRQLRQQRQEEGVAGAAQ